MSRWLVDGMNVIGARPDGWWRDRKQAMVNLVDTIERWAAAHAADREPVTVVFDGDRPDELKHPGGQHPEGQHPEGQHPEGQHPVDIVFAGRGRTADDEIAARVAADPDPGSLIVATSDRALTGRVVAHGAQVIGAGTFRRRLDGDA